MAQQRLTHTPRVRSVFASRPRAPLSLPSSLQPSALPDVLANLLALEKKTRLAADAKSTVVVCTALLLACWQCKDFKAINEHLVILTKRRAQLQKVIESVIQQGARFVKEVDVSTPAGEEKQRELIETLRTVSSGKMFVELERAQLTQILAAMEEKAGKVKEAADILQEIQVETIGSMDVQEKANYLLEQIRLVLLKRDFVRVEIISKKLATKQFREGDAPTNPMWQQIKIKYYNLMIQYHLHYAHYFEIAKAYREVRTTHHNAQRPLGGTVWPLCACTLGCSFRAFSLFLFVFVFLLGPPLQIFNTNIVQSDPSQWQDALSKLVIYGLLSPWDAELSDLLHRVSKEKKIEQLPAIKQLLTEFIGDEIMNWPLSVEKEIKSDSTFTALAQVEQPQIGEAAMSDVPVAQPVQILSNDLDVSATEAERKEGASSGSQRWNDLHKRIAQHNIRVIASYYARITSARLASLLKLDEAKTEILLSEMVSTKQLYGKMDRPAGIISFVRPQPATEILHTYANDLSSLLQLVEKTCHMISKENMIHNLK